MFRTVLQGLVISMCPIEDPEDAKALQNFIICIEMFISGCTMYFAFPVADFKIGGVAAGMRMGAIIHAISIRDVLADVMHQFAGVGHGLLLHCQQPSTLCGAAGLDVLYNLPPVP